MKRFRRKRSNKRKHLPVWLKTEVQQTLSDIFEAAYDENICDFDRKTLARKAKLHYSTIYGLETNIHRVPSYGTILKLCRAVGMDTQLVAEQLSPLRVVG